MSRGSPKYRSKFETKFAAFLTANGIKFKYESGKIKFAVRVRGGECPSCGAKDVIKHRYYVPDFRVGAHILETKGRLTSAERTKFIAIRKVEPNISLVFQRDNPIRRGSSVKYTDWCRDNGITCYVGPSLPPSVVSALRGQRKYKEPSVKAKQTPTAKGYVVSTRTKKSGPTMAGTKVKKNGKVKRT